ncbi:MAG: alpha/beta hydrolase, partial [Planktotalea sp.]|uniref:alpha/beta hydrolase n=1 Tax=Planktotalea sp. TaxID=2029877 RepID=UPI003C70B86B
VYTAQSAATYAAHPDVQTLRYGTSDTQSIDLFMPETDAPAPLHIFIHGGYWQALSKTDSTFPAQGFLDQGVAFAAVDYTLAPDASVAQIAAECREAVSYLFEQADALGVDPARICLSGSSAGAHLAAITCLDLAPEHRPLGVILLSGVYELEPLLGTYINEPLKMSLKDAHDNSPALRDLANFPPALVAWGEIEPDEFKRQSQSFAVALPKAEALEIPARNHFDIVHDLSNTSDLAQRISKLCKF